jgi:nucleoside-diphosphate-sugar epimerase
VHPQPDTLRLATFHGEKRSVRVCITGATGFLGGALTRRLLAEGVQVRALARPSAKADQIAAAGAQVIRGDLSDPVAINLAVEDAEILYHVAAIVEAPGDLADFLDANRGGTERVFQAALQHNVRRIIYSSSIAVYGLAAENQTIDESTPYDDQPALRDSYSQSKIQADAFAVRFAKDNAAKISVTVLRPGVIYGPGKRLPFGLLGFNAGKTNVVFANPENRYPLNYIENLVDTMQLAATAPPNPTPREYIILDDDHLTLAQYHQARHEIDHSRAIFFSGAPVLSAAKFAEAIRIVKPGSSDFNVRQVSRALQNRHYSSRRIRQELNWSPRVPLREALRASIAPPKPLNQPAARAANRKIM